MRGARRGVVLAAMSLVLAGAASVWLAAWPCAYEGQTATMPGDASAEVHTCSSLVDVNGTWVLWLLAVPIALTVAGFIASRSGVRWAAIAVALVYLMLCLVSFASIGLLYLPSAIALVASAIAMPSRNAAAVAPGSG